ncbi:MAG TPA: S-layer homology domain-containing protein [Clostridiales bacterium]|nr:S-layer homology domain-containing protein [Clostridiales bacterium]
MKKRIISLLLCLVLIVSLVPAAAAADTGDARTVTVRYASGHGENDHDYEATFTYSDELFTKSGYTHRQDLAEMSLGLAFAAFSSKDSQYSDNYATGNRNFVSMAKQCGFENIQSNKWMFQPAETDSIGINCASKTIRDNGGSYTLIAVGVRGNNYHAEWGGNVRLDATGEHKGFALGRDQALDYLRSYIADTGISGRVKIWIAGYSRSAAVANMVSGALDNGYSLGEGVSLSPHDLYCYCYEPPMGTTKNQVQGRLYDNIQNIVNANDVVTYVPFDSWDFARYGVDHVVPTKGDDNYLNYKAKMLREFYQIPNNGGNIYWPDHFQAWGIDPKDITSGDLGKIFKVNMTQKEFYADLSEAITTCLVSSRADYAENMQDFLIALLGDIFGKADRDTSAVAMTFAKKLQDNWQKIFYSLTIPGMIKNGTAVRLITGYLVEALQENGIVTYDLEGIEAAVAMLVPRLSKMALKYPGTTMTLLANLVVIMSAHFGESCLAWMRSLPDDYMTSKQTVSYVGLFDDVAAEAWYAPAVDYVKYGRLMYGTGNNLFQPDAQMTRAMLAQVLYELEGAPSVKGLSCPFTDVGGSWYTDAVIWAYNAGVVAGVSATQFAPNEALTREQMVTMLFGYAGREETLSGSDGALASYQDQASVSGWAREAMAWAVSSGVISGTSATTLAPQKIGTRAEVATVLMQFCEQ